MLISGITAEDLEAAREVASEALGNEFVFSEFTSTSAKRHKVRLQVWYIDDPGARRHSHMYFMGYAKTLRRSRFPCAHAYGFLFVAVYERNPDAYIRTAFATYHGSREFRALYEDVLYRNVGSATMPMAFADECTCESDFIDTTTIEEWPIGDPAMPSRTNTATVAR